MKNVKTMNIAKIQPILDEPVLLLEKFKMLVVADLHIGIESELSEQGISTSNQTKKMLDKLFLICEKQKFNDIVFLGDVKHNIPSSTIKERRDVKVFLERISQYANVHIIPGNHDGNIHKLTTEEIIIHPSDGFIFKKIGFIHGHRWPNDELMDCDQIIMAHTHPTIMISDRREFKTYEPCWIKAKFLKEKFEKRYSKPPISNILIVPAFNPLCGGMAVNKNGISGPLGKIIDTQNSEVYLLDGTLLGLVKYIK